MQKPETIKLMGGTLCLEFVNSADWYADGSPVEAEDGLLEPDSLVRWGRRLGLLEDGTAGDAELAAARELRPLLRGLLIAAVHGGSPPRDAAAALVGAYAEATAAAQLARRGDSTLALDWPDADPRKVRFAVVADAIALLADRERLERVHLCPGRDCGWLFLDASGRRKWCSMATCGSRAKMRAMYARRKTQV